MIAPVEQHRAAIAALCRHYGVLRLYLFGSAATGVVDAATSGLDFIATFADTKQPVYGW